MRFTGKLLQGERVVIENLSGTIQQHDTGGVIGWKGRLDLPKGLSGQEYEVLFEDGRRAQITVHSSQDRSGRKHIITFTVNGGIDEPGSR